jgi:DNA polymerase-4/DNA polymerase V
VNPTPLNFPQAILHVDGDAFFTSVEQALHPSLRGRPVVTGKERGIIACASYEAKAIGIKRGIALWEARRKCPDLVILPSDYETYSTFSKRMFEIMRRYSPTVEEYSIDEGFADITGMDRYFRRSYHQIARALQQAIHRELDLTASVGLSLTKSLAKVASDFRKPNGLTAVGIDHLDVFLKRIPVADVWGLGRSRVRLLDRFGIKTAWDYAQQPRSWIEKHLHKPGGEIWYELRGQPIMRFNTQPHTPIDSISKSKTFTTPSCDTDYIYAKLVRNLESACIKLRRHQLMARDLFVALRLNDYRESGLSVRLPSAAQTPVVFIPAVRGLFNLLYEPGGTYRSTTIVLSGLESSRTRQYELFENHPRVAHDDRIGCVIDSINRHYGKHTLHLATGIALKNDGANSDRGTPCWRRQHLLAGETARKRIHLPLLDMHV